MKNLIISTPLNRQIISGIKKIVTDNLIFVALIGLEKQNNFLNIGIGHTFTASVTTGFFGEKIRHDTFIEVIGLGFQI